jgi:UDP-N-acetylmuramate dehydrogenase
MDEIYQNLKKYGKVKANESLAKHNTFKIGGLARYFVIVTETDKLVELLGYLLGEDIKYFILGDGSNVLLPDEYDGVVIKIKNKTLEIKDNSIIADAGVQLSKVISLVAQNELTGMEWGIGIPGSIGGAVRGNAGAYGSDISESVFKVEILRDGEVIELKNNNCEFNYRESIFKSNNDVILRAYFKLEKGDKNKIMQKMQEYSNQRTCRVTANPTCGCFFKNIKLEDYKGDKSILEPKFIERGKVPAGWLIEKSDCANIDLNKVKVSDRHSNIIENKGEATQADILNLVEDIKTKVYNKFGVELQPEVEIVN